MSESDTMALEYICERLDVLIKVTAAAALIANAPPDTANRQATFDVLKANSDAYDVLRAQLE